MMRDWLIRTNLAYDELDRASPSLRFLLFLFPMLLACVLDVVFIIYGMVPFLFYVVMALGGAWRIGGVMLINNSRD